MHRARYRYDCHDDSLPSCCARHCFGGAGAASSSGSFGSRFVQHPEIARVLAYRDRCSSRPESFGRGSWYRNRLGLQVVFDDPAQGIAVFNVGRGSLTVWELEPNEARPSIGDACSFPVFDAADAAAQRDELICTRGEHIGLAGDGRAPVFFHMGSGWEPSRGVRGSRAGRGCLQAGAMYATQVNSGLEA